jgi:5-(carboxyamino)imidazole ribonucleotide synthase
VSAAILPGATIGLLGGGQLGRMFALEARRMGYRVHTLAPEGDTPAGQISDLELRAEYDDLERVREFARGVDVVTFEFENVPTSAAEAAAELAPVRPAGAILHVTQQRRREKEFLVRHRFPVAPHTFVRTATELASALARTGFPAILKSVEFGYDGRGQCRIDAEAELEAAWRRIGPRECVVEALVDFELECSVVAARAADGSFAHWGIFENRHSHHVLDVSVTPSRLDPRLATRAIELAREIVEALDLVGVLCVELFVTRSGDLLVNELAPRPHNSGHLTLDAARTSQFEQQLRAVCGLPLGDTALFGAAAMANLLGDLWLEGEPDWIAAIAEPGVKLHLYGKSRPEPGRKMGHLTVVDETPERALERVVRARAALTRRR